MTDKTIVRCEQCGQIYTVRVVDDQFVLPAAGNTCACGGTSFTDLAAARSPSAP